MITKEILNHIHEEGLVALKKAAKNHGFTVTMHGGTFDQGTSILKYKITDPAGEVAKQKTDFETWASMFDLGPEDHGKIFKMGCQRYRLIGLNPRAPKYPLIVERLEDGRRLKHTLGESLRKQIRASKDR